MKKHSALLVLRIENEEDSPLVIKEGVEQQKLMINILKSAALDNQHLRIPKSSWRNVQYIDDNFEQVLTYKEWYRRYPDGVIRQTSSPAVTLTQNNAKLTWDISPLIPQELVPEE